MDVRKIVGECGLDSSSSGWWPLVGSYKNDEPGSIKYEEFDLLDGYHQLLKDSAVSQLVLLPHLLICEHLLFSGIIPSLLFHLA